MKLSHSWLKDYIPELGTTVDTAALLTEIGLEVEGIDAFNSIPGGLKGVVIGKVLTCVQHLNADKLSITTVDVGGAEILSIVCGAPNVRAGQTVAVATIGTILYDEENKSFEIKESKIRGERSQGMICSEAELNLGKSHDGIMVFETEIAPGTRLTDYFNISSDEIYEIGLTPNRADANSHFGTARDLWAALNFRDLTQQDLQYPHIAEGISTSDSIVNWNITIENKDKCSRYSGILISEIVIAESPDWLKQRLMSIGQTPINNIVDITNYVMFELGQPLHAFDASKISNQSILVKTLQTSTPFTTLNQKEIKLDEDDLMICDGLGQPMCMAGVMGGIDSGVTTSTTQIFLESAHFNQASIRRSSLRHDLRTESASHFEKGTDPGQTIWALKRAAYLIESIQAGKISSSIVDIYPNDLQSHTITIKPSYIQQLLGKEIPKNELEKVLNGLKMKLEVKADDLWLVTIPTHKTDVTRPADLVEEIVRIYGLNHIEPSGKFLFALSPNKAKSDYSLRKDTAITLKGLGYHEIMGLSIINGQQASKWLTYNEDQSVKVNNTSNTHLDLLRPDPIYTALQTIQYNISRQQNRLRLFEFGKSYSRTQGNYQEQNYLAISALGSVITESRFKVNASNGTFFDLKNAVYTAIEQFTSSKIKEKGNASDPRFSLAIDLIVKGETIATMGLVKSKILKEASIKTSMCFAHIYWEKINKIRDQGFSQYQEISKFPYVRRDLSLVIDESIPFQKIQNVAFESAGKSLQEVILFDVYQNEEQLGPQKISLAIGFVFVNPSKTFDDTEIESLMSKLIANFEQKFQAMIRK